MHITTGTSPERRPGGSGTGLKAGEYLDEKRVTGRLAAFKTQALTVIFISHTPISVFLVCPTHQARRANF